MKHDDRSAVYNYRYDLSKTPEQRLTSFFENFGLSEDVPMEDEGVDLAALLDLLPKTNDEGEENPAHKELEDYLTAIPPKRRAYGVYSQPERLLALMLDRMEFFEGLSRNLVRVCKGVGCPVYNVCPYQDQMRHVTEEDHIPCAVERDVVRSRVEAFVYPKDGSQPLVDPRKPQMALLFQQLLQLLVKQTRLSMQLQKDDVQVDHYEILRRGDDDQFETANKQIHPLIEAWDRNQETIRRLMKDMGITPEFQIRQGIWVDSQSKLDAESRAKELAAGWLMDTFERQLKAVPENDPSHQMLKEALSEAKKLAEEIDQS